MNAEQHDHIITFSGIPPYQAMQLEWGNLKTIIKKFRLAVNAASVFENDMLQDELGELYAMQERLARIQHAMED